jgi:hypothetical protein
MLPGERSPLEREPLRYAGRGVIDEAGLIGPSVGTPSDDGGSYLHRRQT